LRTTRHDDKEVKLAKPVDVKRDANSEKRELTVDELNAVTGGDARPCPPQSNILKSHVDTTKGMIGNIR
jgi:hypothetical protein